MPKDVWQGCRCHARQHHKFLGLGSSFGAKYPKGSEMGIIFLAMDQIGHVLRVDLQDV